METILITGMVGGLAKVVAKKLTDKYDIIGVDFRPYQGNWPYSGKFLRVDYNKRTMMDIFHDYKIKKVLHLGRIGNLWERFSKRYDLNVMGTSNILQICSKYNVETILIFSTFHIYGAHPHNPTNIEEDQPLRAAQTFPELIDAVELDHLGTTFLWKNPNIRTIILRPCNVVGANIQNTISRILRNPYIPYLMGFDPMQQFIHEDDAADAISLALENIQVNGIYNIVGNGAIPWQRAIKICNGTGIPIPYSLAYTIGKNLNNLGVFIPTHLMDYFRYPVIISDQKFRQTTGYHPKVSTIEAVKMVKNLR